MKKTFLIASAITSSLFLTACSGEGGSPMNAGERISQRGGEIRDYGQSWADGRKDVQEGQRIVEKSNDSTADAEKRLVRAQEALAKAEAQIDQARIDRTNGELLITGGSAQMQRAEAGYSSVREGPSAIADQAN